MNRLDAFLDRLNRFLWTWGVPFAVAAAAGTFVGVLHG